MHAFVAFLNVFKLLELFLTEAFVYALISPLVDYQPGEIHTFTIHKMTLDFLVPSYRR